MKWIISLFFIILITPALAVQDYNTGDTSGPGRNFCESAIQTDERSWLMPSRENCTGACRYYYCLEGNTERKYNVFRNESGHSEFDGVENEEYKCHNETHLAIYRCDGSTYYYQCPGECSQFLVFDNMTAFSPRCLDSNGQRVYPEPTEFPKLCSEEPPEEPPVNVPEFPTLIAVGVISAIAVFLLRKR